MTVSGSETRRFPGLEGITSIGRKIPRQYGWVNPPVPNGDLPITTAPLPPPQAAQSQVVFFFPPGRIFTFYSASSASSPSRSLLFPLWSLLSPSLPTLLSFLLFYNISFYFILFSLNFFFTQSPLFYFYFYSYSIFPSQPSSTVAPSSSYHQISSTLSTSHRTNTHLH